MALLNTQYILPPDVPTVPDTSGRFAFDPLNMSVKPDYSSLQMINDPTMQELLMQERQRQPQVTQQEGQAGQAPMSDRNQKLGLMLYALGGALRGDKDFVQNTLALQQMQEGKKKQEARKKAFDELLEKINKDSPLYDFAKAMGYENVDKLALEMYKAETAVPEEKDIAYYKAYLARKYAEGIPLNPDDLQLEAYLANLDRHERLLRGIPKRPSVDQEDNQQQERINITDISEAEKYPKGTVVYLNGQSILVD